MSSSPSWYDLLGVSADASPEQIKAAWRNATDKFEPGSGTGQFRLFNQAADVLLDPARRSAYDEELAAAAGSSVTGEPAGVPASEASAQAATTAPEKGGRRRLLGNKSRLGSGDLSGTPTVTAVLDEGPAETASAPDETTTADARRPDPGWLRLLGSTTMAAVLAVLTVLAVSAAAVLWYLNHRHDEAAAAGQEASAAAQRALPVVLSYDYRHLEADRDHAVKFLTPKYRREYTATFDKLIKTSNGQTGPAAQTSAVVKATVRSVGVVDSEPDLAKVIVFVDQATTKNGGTPKYSLNRLTVSLVKSGNSWLVDNINSY